MIDALTLKLRIALLEREMLSWTEEVWNQEKSPTVNQQHPWIEESLRRLTRRWPAKELGILAADMYFHPALWQHKYEWRNEKGQFRQDKRRFTFNRILRACVEEFPPPDLCVRLRDRLRLIAGSGALIWNNYVPYDFESGQRLDPTLQRQLYGSTSDALSPDRGDCLDLLKSLPDTEEALDLMEEVVHGPLDVIGWPSTLPLVERLFEHERFGYESFVRACLISYHMTRDVGDPDGWPYVPTRVQPTEASPGLREALRSYVERLVREFLRDLPVDQYFTISEIKAPGISPDLLLGALKLHAERWGKAVQRYSPGGSTAEFWHGRYLQLCIDNLARAADSSALSVAERDALVDRLGSFPPESLERILPLAARSRDVLAEALGWKEALPLIELLARAGRMYGELDAQDIRRAIEDAGEQTTRRILRLFREAKVGAEDTVRLFESAAGWNHSWIEEKLTKRNQLAVRAFGLLPVERGESEVLERHLFLKRFEREGKKFGPQRQSSEQDAIRDALTNLAWNAGYADKTRLEWAMESRLGSDEAMAPDKTWHVEGYEVRLTFSEGSVRLVFWREGRTLKSVPAAVRNSGVYPTIKNTLSKVRDQVSRLRATFEGMMATGETLSRDDLHNLSRIPAASMLLAALVLREDDGRLGLLEIDHRKQEMSLRSLGGSLRGIAGSTVIAHPYHLFDADQLSEWQKEIVRRRLVQPFKQAFRELYLPTPAEEETSPYSMRFDGHETDSRVTARLLESRGWSFGEGEGDHPRKVFGSTGATANFEVEYGHYFTEEDTVSTERIYFQNAGGALMDVADVPPTVFSEAMRDADLVVSVAGTYGGERLSEEAYERRGDVIRALLDELGLPGVGVEGHFARVIGKLAHYRVHMGSAAIHIDPGNYLCVVPERWGRRHKDLFLPFADEGDKKVSEVVSKVLMLANDDRIKDQSILAQIRTRS